MWFHASCLQRNEKYVFSNTNNTIQQFYKMYCLTLITKFLVCAILIRNKIYEKATHKIRKKLYFTLPRIRADLFNSTHLKNKKEIVYFHNITFLRKYKQLLNYVTVKLLKISFSK